MATSFRVSLRLAVLLRPALLTILTALYLSPLATHGVRTSWQRTAESDAARDRLQAARARAGAAAHATPLYFQEGLFAPLRLVGSDLCYIELMESQIRVIETMAAP